MKQLMFGITTALLLSGCAWRTQIERGTVSTYKMDLNKCYEIDRSERIKGTDRAHSLWLIPLGSPDAQEAVDNTLRDANKKLSRKVVGIADADVKFRFLWLYFYSQRWYTVEGYPIYEKQSR